jgi:hypothetical protein
MVYPTSGRTAVLEGITDARWEEEEREEEGGLGRKGAAGTKNNG